VLGRYVLADVVRNPRRSVSTAAGIVLGVGLFCGVLFFVDGLSASMTQRAVEPLAIDMQRIVTQRIGNNLELTQHCSANRLTPGETATLTLDIANRGRFAANEVTVRSTPGRGLRFVVGSATLDGRSITGYEDNPLSHGPGQEGLNLGTLQPGAAHHLEYDVEATAATRVDDRRIPTAFSTREAVSPTPANQPATVPLADLAGEIRTVPGVERAEELSIADLGAGALSAGGRSAFGATKIFGFAAPYARRDATITFTRGRLHRGSVAISVEAAKALGLRLGDPVAARLPNGSMLSAPVSAILDLSQARSLYSSRRGGDLETFVYSPNAIVVSPEVFATEVFPAYEAAATAGADRLKNPPIREVDIRLARQRLDADPAAATHETKRIAADIAAVADHQDYLLDNITNALIVASDDADVAKRLFVFLGVPGALLAAVLAGYAGHVLAEAQRREQATLRVRGASRRHLLRMLALRTAVLTVAGATMGLVVGYLGAAVILGGGSLERVSTSRLVVSGLLGVLGGFVATGAALYVTGRRSIDREINEDRARLSSRAPLWRRAGLDIVLALVVVVGTVIAIDRGSFNGTPGSVYFGRSVQLELALLVLPIAVWLAGSLLAARVLSALLGRTRPPPGSSLTRPVPSLFRRSASRRSWAIGNGAIVVTLIVGLSASLAAFTASYDAAKVADSRFANGADIRVTPRPGAEAAYPVTAVGGLRTAGIRETTPVVYGVSNVVLRSDRTSDPVNLAAVDPVAYRRVAPVSDRDFGSHDAARSLARLARHPKTILVNPEIADFLNVEVGDTVHALLARSTEQQIEVPLRIDGLFERLPGFPDGADALMAISGHFAAVPGKNPDFFLARPTDPSDAGLHRALHSLERGPGISGDLRFDTRETMLARDQSSLAALNIAGLIDLDGGFALSMAAVTIAIFVFGLLLARRREYVTLRAQGLEARGVRRLITAEAGTVAVAGAVAGVLVGAAMGYYFVRVLRPLFVLQPRYSVPIASLALPVVIVVVSTVVASLIAAWMVQRLEPTELLRDD
jgi:putative ABC transport system permease protein